MRVSGQIMLRADVADDGTVNVPFRFGATQDYANLDFATAVVTRNSNTLAGAAYSVAQAQNDALEDIPAVVLTNLSGAAWKQGDYFSVQIAYAAGINEVSVQDALASLDAVVEDHEARIVVLETAP